jgi:hypothetical protein
VGGARFRGGSQIEATAALIGSPAGIVEFANGCSGVTIAGLCCDNDHTRRRLSD